MYLFSFEKHGNNFNVHDTVHVNEKRGRENGARNSVYPNEKIYEILNEAASSLTQYRNKGVVGITFFNENGGTNAFLVALEGEQITIITMLTNTKRNVNDVFYGSFHLFLRGYRFFKKRKYVKPKEHIKQVQVPVKSRLKITKKQGKRVQTQTSINVNEDDEFIKSMKNVQRI